MKISQVDPISCVFCIYPRLTKFSECDKVRPLILLLWRSKSWSILCRPHTALIRSRVSQFSSPPRSTNALFTSFIYSAWLTTAAVGAPSRSVWLSARHYVWLSVFTGGHWNIKDTRDWPKNVEPTLTLLSAEVCVLNVYNTVFPPRTLIPSWEPYAWFNTIFWGYLNNHQDPPQDKHAFKHSKRIPKTS